MDVLISMLNLTSPLKICKTVASIIKTLFLYNHSKKNVYNVSVFSIVIVIIISPPDNFINNYFKDIIKSFPVHGIISLNLARPINY